MPSKPTYRVAVLLYPNADILDYAGPMEVLSHATWNRDRFAPEPVFEIHTAARVTNGAVSTGDDNLHIQPSISIKELRESLSKYHVLVVPGGAPEAVQKVVDQPDGLELSVVREFAELGRPDGEEVGQERVLLSVCTGALLLGAAGLLAGLTVTTHHMFVDRLEEVCNKENTGKKTVVVSGRRFVDAGIAREGLRIVTAGGVSSGLDAALHVVEVVSERNTAEFVAKIIEYERRQV